MKVLFENNSNLDTRHALFTITEYKKKTFPPFSFELKCSNNKYLCANGWQNTCAPLKVQGFKESNGIILLFVDSDIINYLDAKKVYTFILNSHEQPPQSTALILNPLDFMPHHNAEIKINCMKNEPNLTEIATSQNSINPEISPQLNNTFEKLTAHENMVDSETMTDNPNIMQVNTSPNTSNENEPIIDHRHYPLIKWFLAIWLSGCLLFGYLMFKEQIDNYFSNAPTTIQDSLNNASQK